ncbi:hypothetical protein MSKU15_1014 [Komagataeibacter diospyri]|uniref:STAS-like domain-containing protein n=1 Tax=Komagataeibacter diospyri TaxID=1932662 RepID=UPI00113807F0|nr:STAS-like domain-containing protein [Komagataeibacter diospyri]GCE89413.1 hypothetical protein MSKU15_1014 [Komagataeibacter diospyri]
MITIRIAKEFSTTPGGRFKSMGPSSGEEFRAQLIKALKANDYVKVILDGTEGYGSSFLEEAFGGLIRLQEFPPHDVLSRLAIVAETPDYVTYANEAMYYMVDAASQVDNKGN